MSSTVLFAQTTPHFTQIVPDGYNGFTMIINASVVINGETQADPNLELGVFSVATGECRATKYPGSSTPFGTYYYNLSVKAVEGELLTYKLYNHQTDELLEDVVFSEDYPQVSFAGNEQFGNARTPWFVYFESSNGYTIEIDPYADEKDNYYLIASPVGAVKANEVEGLQTPNFDFYSFNQSGTNGDGLEWINLREEEEYELQPGIGYLYANNTGTDITFYGTGITEGTYELALDYDATAEDFPGWNLMGNPFSVNATSSKPYYRMQDGAFLPDLQEGEINPMEGFFVCATAEGEVLTIIPATGGKGSSVALNLSDNGKVIDRAIVSFGKNQQLPKLQLFKNNSKVYIPQNGTEYAIVSSEGIGSMPVNFKAEKTGSYSFTVSSDNTQFNYLHLIDHLTGVDVDLLATPSYSFDARISDYASRFQLVFATGNSDDNNFAFYNNGNIIVNNNGSAVLNIVDILGRTISSKNINGSENISINAKAGVYTLQLVQGDNVKTQKIVVK